MYHSMYENEYSLVKKVNKAYTDIYFAMNIAIPSKEVFKQELLS